MCNSGQPDTAIRTHECRNNCRHTMPLAVASRFAVLRIEGDHDDEPRKNPKKAADGKTTDPKKKNVKPDNKKVNQPNAVTKSKAKAPSTGQSKKKNSVTVSDQQWAQWQKKDAQVADVTYEVELNEAILLSKVDYEKNKAAYNQRKKEAEEEKKIPTVGAKKSKKSSKPLPMSLDQFNNLNTEPDAEVVVVNERNGVEQEDDEEFFNRIAGEAKETIEREECQALRKARQPDVYKAITQAQYEDTLEKKDQQITVLNEEVVKLKEELHNVKLRNKRLCQILANGEMKEKAELLIELDRLYRERAELSSEVTSLHIQLEQERSKNSTLTADPKNKAQSKKRATSDSKE